VAVATVANSIVSGGGVERITNFAYFYFSVVYCLLIYPFIARWGFHSKGWLVELGFHDLAGSGIVHTTGGICALILTVLLKPRLNRFDAKHIHTFEPSNPTYVALATLLLYVCCLFFNSGAIYGVTGGLGEIVGLAAMNTMIGGAAGGLTVCFINYFVNVDRKNRYSLVMLCNGAFAGVVSITAGCDNYEPWAAFTIGCIGGVVYVVANHLMLRL
jgi:Amt family ammonium transporter